MSTEPSTDIEAEKLPDLCQKLLILYESNAYKDAFPEIQNIAPVRDPAKLEELNKNLLDALRNRDQNLNFTVPDIINYSDNLYVSFGGAGGSLIYDDVYIGRYFDYLHDRDIDINKISIEDLRRHTLILTDEDGKGRDRYSIFKSLVFDVKIEADGGETFHICEGNWYRIENAYIRRLCEYLDPLFKDCDLPPYTEASEGDYNAAVAAENDTLACLDRLNISPDGQSQVEPCDLLALRDDFVTLYHVKVSTLSAQLSHLFNQGVNSVELMRLESKAIDKFEALIAEKLQGDYLDKTIEYIRASKYRIVFGIVTRKNPAAKSLNLPLFSRISLMRGMKALQLMSVSGNIIYIPDHTKPAGGRKKKRKKKDVAEVAE